MGQERMTSTIERSEFGRLADGRTAWLFSLRSPVGVHAAITNYGAALVSFVTPDRHGALGETVLGYREAASYEAGTQYLGAIIGRFANRIARATFSLGGREFRLIGNDHGHCLHGGTHSFDKALWAVTRADCVAGSARLQLDLRSADGEGGFPGNVSVTATYSLNPAGRLCLRISATSDGLTILNCTSHPYFNLSGQPYRTDVSEHVLEILGSSYLPITDDMIPTGEVRRVDGSPFDFRTPTTIGSRIEGADDQLRLPGGYDHTWVMDRPAGLLSPRARLEDPASGRTLTIWSTEPGLQFYSGNVLDKERSHPLLPRFLRRAGLCLEPQKFPDSPNRVGFPSTLLEPGMQYLWESHFQPGTTS